MITGENSCDKRWREIVVYTWLGLEKEKSGTKQEGKREEGSKRRRKEKVVHHLEIFLVSILKRGVADRKRNCYAQD